MNIKKGRGFHGVCNQNARAKYFLSRFSRKVIQWDRFDTDLPGQFTCGSELTFDNVNSERNRLLASLENSETKIFLVDLTHVVRCDSAGLALLIDAKRLCRAYKKTFKIVNMPSVVIALAEFCAVKLMLQTG